MALSPAFGRYIDGARNGRAQLWRILLGIVLITVTWVASTVMALALGAALSGLFQAVMAGDAARTVDAWELFQEFLGSALGVAATLMSFIGMSAGVYLAVRLIHRRPFGTVLGAERRIAWPDFARGLAASLLASALAEAATFLVDPSLRRNDISLAAWLAWLGPLVLLLFVQVSAEELAFRGYLLQSLAARFRSPLIWALLPLALFTSLHFDAHSTASMEIAMLAGIASFAVLATVLVVRTGNLGAGIGAHLGLNMFGLLFVSHTSWLSGAALFVSRPLDFGVWSPLDAFLVGAFSIVSFALMLVLLVHPRSPLKLAKA